MELEEVIGLALQIMVKIMVLKILGWGGTNYSGTKIGPKRKPGYTKAIKYWFRQ